LRGQIEPLPEEECILFMEIVTYFVANREATAGVQSSSQRFIKRFGLALASPPVTSVRCAVGVFGL
jgi:hypothetical protein